MSEDRKFDSRIFCKYEWYVYAGYLHKAVDENLNNHNRRQINLSSLLIDSNIKKDG